MSKLTFRTRRKFSTRPIQFLALAALLSASLYDPYLWLPVLGWAGLLYLLVKLVMSARAQARGELSQDESWGIWLVLAPGFFLEWEAWKTATGHRPNSHGRGFNRLLDLAIDLFGALPTAALVAALGSIFFYAGYEFWRRR